MERLIVDGYNVLHAHPTYASMARTDIDAARARLVADLAGYATGGPRTVVVFDGGANPASDGTPHHLGALTVIFSPAGTTADTVIEGLAARSRERGERATVVTSDGETRRVVRTGTISIRSADSFVAEIGADLQERMRGEDGRGRSGGSRVPLGERVPADVAGVLARWARGEQPEHPHAG